MNGKGLLGKGIITKYLGDSNARQTFIRKEMAAAKQEVWAPRLCCIQITSLNSKGEFFNLVLGKHCSREIAHPYRIGITPSKYKLIKPISKYPRMRMDNFEIIKGMGQCF